MSWSEEVHAVLIRPHEGDPLGLLADGPCGSKPPTAIKLDRRYHRLKDDDGKWLAPADGPHAAPPDALALAWGKEPVREGTYRIRDHALMEDGSPYGLALHILNKDTLLRGAAINLLSKWGTVILLGADYKELGP